MKLIRISAVWCSSCIIMKQRLNKIIENTDIEVIDFDYDLDYDKIEEYEVGDVLPVLIYGSNRLIGEHSKEEIEMFLRID